MRKIDLAPRRKALSLTQLALARRVGVTANTVARWERGELPMPSQASSLLELLEGIAETEEQLRPAPEALNRLGEAIARAGLMAELDEGDIFLSETQAANRLGISRSEVRRLESRRRLKPLRQPLGTSRPGALALTDQGERVYPEAQVLKLSADRARKGLVSGSSV
jgi:transcriptional regulator with XRE-family HTH domain